MSDNETLLPSRTPESRADRIEIHQSQPLVWPSDLLYFMLAGCDWWISIRSVDNTQDWQKL